MKSNLLLKRQYLCTNAIFPGINRQTQLLVCFNCVTPIVLKAVSTKLVAKTNSPTFMSTEIDTPLPAASICFIASANWFPQSHLADPKMSPVRHSECTLTRISSPCPISPCSYQNPVIITPRNECRPNNKILSYHFH